MRDTVTCESTFTKPSVRRMADPDFPIKQRNLQHEVSFGGLSEGQKLVELPSGN